ncbi:IclR family transcriptional regulator [Streptomyces sp. NBC_01210]|uniref:IclR family transcriptional regulator n=1 Tax=Streptomyces sp. NBC_01210 TaxID=2903774 RepID=UPI002E12F7B8|nr:IclR family transcriptional regulator [Streptomyces sp. NBC_01210]
MVRAAQRAARLLRVLAEADSRLGVTDIADRLGIAKGTAHALLRTLEAEGMVMQHRKSAKYQLGPEMLVLGHAYLNSQELRSRSLVWTVLLAARTGEAVWVGALTGVRLLVVHHAPRTEGGSRIPEMGEILPWSTAALGKAVVAFLAEGDRERLLEGELATLTEFSVSDAAELRAQLEQVRLTGYALEDQETFRGEGGIAAPVFDRGGEVVGAIGIVGPVERLLRKAVRQDLAEEVREIARLLSRELGSCSGRR